MPAIASVTSTRPEERKEKGCISFATDLAPAPNTGLAGPPRVGARLSLATSNKSRRAGGAAHRAVASFRQRGQNATALARVFCGRWHSAWDGWWHCVGLACLTFGVSSMGDSQGSRVGVDAIRDHAVEHPPPSRNLVTRQQPHDPGVAMVELPEEREDKLWSITWTCGLRPFPSWDAAAVSNSA